jgi:molybdenum cofactor cytidylyltransferase
MEWSGFGDYGVVVLAAGASRRMGVPKLLLPWGEDTILGRQVRQWRRLGAVQVAVVHAPDQSALLVELDRLNIPKDDRIPNPEPERGMFSSVVCAAAWGRWAPGLTHLAISLGDQPHLRAQTLTSLLAAARSEPGKIWQPERGGRPRHPVVLPRIFFCELATTRADTLRTFLHSHAPDVKLCSCEDPGLGLDIDTPEDYERAKQLAKTQHEPT